MADKKSKLSKSEAITQFVEHALGLTFIRMIYVSDLNERIEQAFNRAGGQDHVCSLIIRDDKVFESTDEIKVGDLILFVYPDAVTRTRGFPPREVQEMLAACLYKVYGPGAKLPESISDSIDLGLEVPEERLAIASPTGSALAVRPF